MQLFWFFLIFVMRSETKYQTKIIGGHEANSAEFPFVVSLQYMDSQKHFCGGTLLRLNHVLSSAHCFKDNPHLILKPSTIVAVGGDVLISGAKRPTRQVREADKVILHENFTLKTYEHDVAIITLKDPFEKTKFVSVLDISKERPSINEVCLTVGWGLTSENSTNYSQSLMVAKVSITDAQNCNKTEFELKFHMETQICAGDPQWKADACKGDSGGPFICNGKLTGMISYGFGCARKGFAGIYTFVPYYKFWIEKTIKDIAVTEYSTKQDRSARPCGGRSYAIIIKPPKILFVVIFFQNKAIFMFKFLLMRLQ